MIIGKEYKKLQKQFNPKQEYCDRCGNDLAVGQSTLMHFPHAKTYIVLCGLCNGGLQFGFYEDFLRRIGHKYEE